jgi:hypothetical protein
MQRTETIEMWVNAMVECGEACSFRSGETANSLPEGFGVL